MRSIGNICYAIVLFIIVGAILDHCSGCQPRKQDKVSAEVARSDEAFLWTKSECREPTEGSYWKVRVNPNLPAADKARYDQAMAALAARDPRALGTALGPLLLVDPSSPP